MEWLTEKRKNIIVNALVFGLIAGGAALGKSFLEGKPLDLPFVQFVLGAAMTAVVVYLQAKQQDIETGAKPGARKPRTKIGL